ncbi:MAG: efflux RND transporter periplasmic adaptor subunit [bacterium]|nr:MAG: efflux RND transporter periplasmic adaptor subunit [bacterium]
MKKPATWKIAIALAALAAVAAAGVVLRKGKDAGREQPTVTTTEPANEERNVLNVVVRVTAPEDVNETFTLPGTLEAWEDLTLSLQRTGTIIWVGPREGDRVRVGEEILRIDTEALQTQQEKIKTDYELKRKQLGRVQTLLQDQLVSQREYDEAYNAFESVKADLQQIAIDLEKSTLKSPIDGILDQLLVDRGEYGTVGIPAAVVVKVDRLKVLVDVPEKDVQATKIGQEVRVLAADVEGDKGPIKTGKIIHVGYAADERTRTYPAKIEIENRTGLLRPGMIVRTRFVRRVLHGVIVVPLDAVLDRDGEKSVFVEEDGAAVRRLVRLGPVVNGSVVIYGGLQPGENLVVKGQQLLSEGGPVKIVEE